MDTKKCPGCGKEIPTSANFCTHCGKKLNAVCIAMIAALKATSNTLVSVIEACEKADKSKMFMEAWHEHTK